MQVSICQSPSDHLLYFDLIIYATMRIWFCNYLLLIVPFCYYGTWQYLRDELSRIDESWAAARFDSLPHVVHILTSKDRESEVQCLKEQSDIIEEVVDEVVHAYHSGFNKAIQNYSQVSNQFFP